jgi:hypothetical protein
MSVNAVPKPFSAHTYIDLTSDEHHHPEELLPATTDGGRCVLQEELSHLKSQLKQLRGKISKLEQNSMFSPFWHHDLHLVIQIRSFNLQPTASVTSMKAGPTLYY